MPNPFPLPSYDPYKVRGTIPKVVFTPSENYYNPWDEDQLNLYPRLDWGPSIRKSTRGEKTRDFLEQILSGISKNIKDSTFGLASLVNPLAALEESFTTPDTVEKMAVVPDPGIGRKKSLAKVITEFRQKQLAPPTRFIAGREGVADVFNPVARLTPPQGGKGTLEQLRTGVTTPEAEMAKVISDPTITAEYGLATGKPPGPKRNPFLEALTPRRYEVGPPKSKYRLPFTNEQMEADLASKALTEEGLAARNAAKEIGNRVNKLKINKGKLDLSEAKITPPSTMTPPTVSPITKNLIDPEITELLTPVTPGSIGKTAPTPWIKAALGDKGKFNQMLSGLNNTYRSIRTKLRSSAPGRTIDDLYTGFRTDKGIMAGKWEARFDDIRSTVPKEQWETLRSSLETGQTLADPKLEQARQALAALDDEISTAAESIGLKLRNADGTQVVPWTRHENYWPHIYNKSFWDNKANIAAAIKAKIPDLTDEQISEIISRAELHGGKFVLESEKLGEAWAKKFGPHDKSFQFMRELNLPGYRTDPEVYKIHIRDIADRIQRQRYFGELDIAAQSGYFHDLIQALPNSKSTKKLLERVFERDLGSALDETRGLNSALLKAETTLHLSRFALSNPSQMAMIGAKGTPKALAKGVADIFRRKERLRFGTESGSRIPIHSDALAGEVNFGDKFMRGVNKAYGIEASETLTRTSAAGIGRDTAEELFTRLKKKPGSTSLRNRLEELILTPVDEALRRGHLTGVELKRAGARMAELTQGRAQSIDLPYHWTGGSAAPWKTNALLFKKYAYLQPNLLLRAARNAPLQTGLIGLGGYYAAGEANQLVKDLVRSGVQAMNPDKTFSESFSEERKKLPNDWTRVPTMLGRGWAFGLPSDFIRGVTGPFGGAGLVNAALPPVASDVIRAIDKVKYLPGLMDDSGSYESERSKSELLKYILQQTPWIGYDLGTLFSDPNMLNYLRRSFQSKPPASTSSGPPIIF